MSVCMRLLQPTGAPAKQGHLYFSHGVLPVWVIWAGGLTPPCYNSFFINLSTLAKLSFPNGFGILPLSKNETQAKIASVCHLSFLTAHDLIAVFFAREYHIIRNEDTPKISRMPKNWYEYFSDVYLFTQKKQSHRIIAVSRVLVLEG